MAGRAGSSTNAIMENPVFFFLSRRGVFLPNFISQSQSYHVFFLLKVQGMIAVAGVDPPGRSLLEIARRGQPPGAGPAMPVCCPACRPTLGDFGRLRVWHLCSCLRYIYIYPEPRPRAHFGSHGPSAGALGRFWVRVGCRPGRPGLLTTSERLPAAL